MRISRVLWNSILLSSLWVAVPEVAIAQRPQVSMQTPLIGTRDSFYENFGTSWSVTGPNFFARFGGSTQPPFGGFNPNSGLTGGFQTRNGPFTTNFNFNFSQGSSRSISSVTPVITQMNGTQGFLINGVQRPFVTSLIPVVNQGMASPFQDFGPANTIRGRLLRGEMRYENGKLVIPGQRGVERQDLIEDQPKHPILSATIDPLPPTRRELAQQIEATQQQELLEANSYWEKGQAAEQNGKASVARIYYQMALKRASGTLKEQIEVQLQQLPK